jgi:hypothetical protein
LDTRPSSFSSAKLNEEEETGGDSVRGKIRKEDKVKRREEERSAKDTFRGRKVTKSDLEIKQNGPLSQVPFLISSSHMNAAESKEGIRTVQGLNLPWCHVNHRRLRAQHHSSHLSIMPVSCVAGMMVEFALCP